MINYYTEQTDYIEIQGKEFKINTDFRLWVELLSNPTIPIISKIFPSELILYTVNSNLDLWEFVKKYLSKNWDYNETEENCEERFFDWVADSDAVYVDFMHFYSLDLSKVELSWHKFQALLNGLPEKSQVNRRVKIRRMTERESKKMGADWSEVLKLKERYKLNSTPTDKETDKLINAYFFDSNSH